MPVFGTLQANFSLNFLAILPMAKILGSITEELADSVGETLGGLLNASFGISESHDAVTLG
ncbi:unnamed protein product [Cladocopium goreaui]|uniref:Vacuolar calcium ion transporter (High copy number undoes manganese protein 1) (Manganese resistance 1 protein) (Vacuolar Ca(2+)/H(+) exchanger) n=1 Tax=Cladocopium goreaui TaxID=2562237 RepID=A0A9P1D8A3_9DINO|nr:unnamed protein product [Cladocopium goreaui]